MFESAVLHICLLFSIEYHLNKNNCEQNDKYKLNMAHKEGRNIMERTIRVLRSCFRCLLRTVHYRPEKSDENYKSDDIEKNFTTKRKYKIYQ